MLVDSSLAAIQLNFLDLVLLSGRCQKLVAFFDASGGFREVGSGSTLAHDQYTAAREGKKRSFESG